MFGRPPKPAAKRFWAKVQKTEGCWNWLGSIARGYGQFRDVKMLKAHRFSWELRYGEIPEDLLVLHSCDNKVCVNPEHLFLGDHLDNNLDMNLKGRCRNGEGTCISMRARIIQQSSSSITGLLSVRELELLKSEENQSLGPVILSSKARTSAL